MSKLSTPNTTLYPEDKTNPQKNQFASSHKISGSMTFEERFVALMNNDEEETCQNDYLRKQLAQHEGSKEEPLQHSFLYPIRIQPRG